MFQLTPILNGGSISLDPPFALLTHLSSTTLYGGSWSCLTMISALEASLNWNNPGVNTLKTPTTGAIQIEKLPTIVDFALDLKCETSITSLLPLSNRRQKRCSIPRFARIGADTLSGIYMARERSIRGFGSREEISTFGNQFVRCFCLSSRSTTAEMLFHTGTINGNAYQLEGLRVSLTS